MARRKVMNGEKSPWGQCLTRTVCARKLVFSGTNQKPERATVWNWSGKTLSPGALLAVHYFSSCHIFFRAFRLFLVPTICPWVSEDEVRIARTINYTTSFMYLCIILVIFSPPKACFSKQLSDNLLFISRIAE